MNNILFGLNRDMRYLFLSLLCFTLLIAVSCNQKSTDKTSRAKGGEKVLQVGIYDWPGLSAGLLWNKGLNSSEDSRFIKKENLKVNFKTFDNPHDALMAWVGGDLDCVAVPWNLVIRKYKDIQHRLPKVIAQTDWDRGNQVLLGNSGEKMVNDLVGKKVGLVEGFDAEFFLFQNLFTAGMRLRDVEMNKFKETNELEQALINDEIDAAVLTGNSVDHFSNTGRWILGTSVLTHSNSHVLLASGTDLSINSGLFDKLYDGWFRCSAEIKAYDDARDSAAVLWAETFQLDVDNVKAKMEKIHFATHGDNLSFSGRNARFKGPSCELEIIMVSRYMNSTRQQWTPPPRWIDMINVDMITNSELFYKIQEQEGRRIYRSLSSEEQNLPALSTWEGYISFQPGEAKIAAKAKQILDQQIIPSILISWLARSRITVHAFDQNTSEENKQLALDRAQAIVDYIVDNTTVDPSRFLIHAAGSSQPIPDCGNSIAGDCLRLNNRIAISVLPLK